MTFSWEVVLIFYIGYNLFTFQDPFQFRVEVSFPRSILFLVSSSIFVILANPVSYLFGHCLMHLRLSSVRLCKCQNLHFFLNNCLLVLFFYSAANANYQQI